MEKFKTSIYLRISKEDEKNNESESIINQKILLTQFVNNEEDLELVSIKIDDGYSGSNFDRPAFKELMEDIRNRKINCVVVKDFSRFSRDFIEASRYIEEIFPFMNVRFISLNDNYDSFKSEDSMDNLIVPFKNLINDSYLRDISIKVRSSLDIKRKNGDFIGSFATYGYLKDPNNKNKLIVDEVASKVVKAIFKDKIRGLSADKIAKKLNENCVLSPMEYKKSIGLNFDTGFKKNAKSLWTPKAVFRILENPIYIGTLEQKKYTTINYKIKKLINVPKEERIIIENNHQPIIEKELFENVQRLMALDTRIAPNKEMVYTLSGIVNCFECGTNLIRKNNGTKDKPYIYYICNNAKNKNGCVGSNINSEKLENIVFNIIKNHISSMVVFEDILKTIDTLPYSKKQIKNLVEIINIKKQQLEKYKNIKIKLCKDLKCEILTEEEYKEFDHLYNNKIEQNKNLINKFEKEIEMLVNQTSVNQLWIQYFKENKNIQSLNRELAVNLIKKIEVSKDKNIKIYFKYKENLV